jgi:hypothetical protein
MKTFKLMDVIKNTMLCKMNMNSTDKTHNPMIFPITYCHRAIGLDKTHDCIPSFRSRLNIRIESKAAMTITPAPMMWKVTFDKALTTVAASR